MSETPDTPETPARPRQPRRRSRRRAASASTAGSRSRRRAGRARPQLCSAAARRGRPTRSSSSLFVAFAASVPFWTKPRRPLHLRHLHAPLRGARAGAERRRRLRRPSRPRLRRLRRGGRVHVRLALVAQVGTPLAGRGDDSDRHGGSRHSSGSARFRVAAAARRLLRDRHALLRPGVLLLREHDESGRTSPAARTASRTTDPITFFGHVASSRSTQQYYFLLVVVTLLAGADVFRQQVAHRAGVARAAGRSARRAGDEHPGEPGQDPRGRHGRRDRGTVRGDPGGRSRAPRSRPTTACSFLILIYAIVILGGVGSIAGVFVGAVIINCTLQFLQPQNDHPEVKRWLFYGTIVLLVLLIKPVWRRCWCSAATVALRLRRACDRRGDREPRVDVGSSQSGGSWITHWVDHPGHGSVTGLNHGNFNNSSTSGSWSWSSSRRASRAGGASPRSSRPCT